MRTEHFWSNLTSLAGYLDGNDQDGNDRALDQLKKELRNTAPIHRKRISVQMAIIAQKLADLNAEAVTSGPSTLVAGETAHVAEKAPS
jgi:hypothetical protein